MGFSCHLAFRIPKTFSFCLFPDLSFITLIIDYVFSFIPAFISTRGVCSLS